jgi:hypothetical protein
VESRDVDPESLRESYKDDPAALAEIEAAQPEGGFTDSGVSLHVVDKASGHELLRFDAFDDGPHYHYIRPSGDHNEVVPFDRVANGDPLDWSLERLRTRLPEMLTRAGGDAAAAQLEAAACTAALDRVAALADDLRRKGAAA